MITEETSKIPLSGSRIGVTAVLLVIFVLLTWMAGRAGFASLLTAYAARVNVIASADAAINLSPGDPEAHLIRGSLLEANNDLPAAISEYRTAASLRPDDYVLWSSLARAAELNGDSAAAIAAARQAIPLAPFYAQPHWQLGNLLIRAGQNDEGFRELRLAGRSNPTLLPAIVDLAWHLSGGNAQFVKQAMQPETSESFQALAEFFKRQGAVPEAIEMYRSTDRAGDQSRRQLLGELLAAGRFADAYSLWSITHPGNSPGYLIDPGFEREQDLDDPGFGWHTDSKAGALTLSLDSAQPKDGRSSLRVDFNGDSNPGAAIISELVLIEPRTHYQLSFAYRTEEIVTGGPPQVFVFDAHDKKVLGHSGALPAKTEGWAGITIDFVSGDSSTAAQISLQRDRCANSTCPIYGRLWLDGFSLQKK